MMVNVTKSDVLVRKSMKCSQNVVTYYQECKRELIVKSNA